MLMGDKTASGKSTLEVGKFTCSECQKVFTVYPSLRQHVRRCHPAALCKLSRPTKSLKYQCSHCRNQFNRINHLKFHERRKHGDPSIAAAIKTHKCPLCDKSFTKKNYDTHLQTEHEVEFETENLFFNSFENFFSWKEDIERETNSKFKKDRGSRVVGNVKHHEFTCHRSGHYVSKGQGLRLLRMHSYKIGAICPANIKVVETGNGECSVCFIKTHVGHQNDIAIPVPKRQTLALKNVVKVPFDDNTSSNITESDNLLVYTGSDVESEVVISEKNGTLLNEQPDLHQKRTGLKRTLLEFIDSLGSEEEMDAFEKILLSAKPIISAVQTNVVNKQASLESQVGSPTNENIQPQSGLWSTNEKRQVTKTSISKPTTGGYRNIIFLVANHQNQTQK